MHELLLESIKRTWYTCQSTWPRRTNQEPRSWANGFFKIEGFGGKRSLLSPPPPPSFHLFALAPFFARPEFEKLIRVRTARILVASYRNACYAGYVREGGWKKKTIVQRRNEEKNSCRANCTLRPWGRSEDLWPLGLSLRHCGHVFANSVRCIPLTNRVRGPYCKLRTEFFSSIYGPSAKRAGHKSKRKKTIGQWNNLTCLPAAAGWFQCYFQHAIKVTIGNSVLLTLPCRVPRTLIDCFLVLNFRTPKSPPATTQRYCRATSSVWDMSERLSGVSSAREDFCAQTELSFTWLCGR